MTFKNTSWQHVLSIAIIVLALTIGFWIRILLPLISYTQFLGDQAEHAFVYQTMKTGNIVTLGPGSSVGGYNLPPLYYWSVAPFVFLTSDPRGQILLNIACSFATIPLLMYFVYRMYSFIPQKPRLLIAGVSGLWWTFLYQEILVNAKEWNTGPLVLVLLLWYLLFDHLFDNKWNRKKQLIGWTAHGILIAYMTSLHSVGLFVVPLAALIIYSIYWRYKKDIVGPLVAIASSIIVLTPYWAGEFKRGFTNSLSILDTVFSSASETHTAFARLDHILGSFFEIGPFIYFIDIPFTNIFSALFILAIAWFASNYSRISKGLLIALTTTTAVYAFSLMNYWQVQFVHYKMLIIFFPVIFIPAFLLAFAESKKLKITGTVILIIFCGTSIWSNLKQINWYTQSMIGKQRIVNTQDIKTALVAIPEFSTICTNDYGSKRAYEYLAQFSVKKQFAFSDNCTPGSYEIIPHYVRTNSYAPPQHMEIKSGAVTFKQDAHLTIVKW
ncbi:MAG: hypothetical protein COW24_04520 [Candidatus Kerfeldbacteria bacterium CG15_BIG_FIL_POST_REV_8_21_14_020_45_12]|uniref:Glycosyltransferase RgtA/B/C/D-like domain-containing protein n=1 Tax=Candidatus Kerfeldbacteria bacterium CG15_BIG_FIL_POST_REV_8_21_14_020_45_12 TaxID=2014247 RepID=A0A2M7H323_9BACT|nr:MAG: hypothetical protein COW24_04520 [Candidatus Kerfeldbacteria bacterium CG15_BIG_FIL_POST_REV_8_21_14_020_45_12]PJA93356.1 MAG: hypothetical protein CO132_03295 [Candidatus Kerfeldbacteria bacterium CG_4_9_14_3_um_filter_45_8]